MLDWLRNIFIGIQNLGEMISNAYHTVVNALTTVISYVRGAAEFISNAFLLIPLYYKVFGGIILVILIVYIILGRNAGGE